MYMYKQFLIQLLAGTADKTNEIVSHYDLTAIAQQCKLNK